MAEELALIDVWHTFFNEKSGDFAASFAEPVGADESSACCVKSVLEGCLALFEEAFKRLEDELVLLRRIIYRHKSQMRNSVHLRNLSQMRTACERLMSGGLQQILNRAIGIVSLNSPCKSPSAELIELMMAKMVCNGILSLRLVMRAEMSFLSCEELIKNALFMPFAITCYAISARIRYLAKDIRSLHDETSNSNLVECHLRLGVLTNRVRNHPKFSGKPVNEVMQALCGMPWPSKYDEQLDVLLELLNEPQVLKSNILPVTDDQTTSALSEVKPVQQHTEGEKMDDDEGIAIEASAAHDTSKSKEKEEKRKSEKEHDLKNVQLHKKKRKREIEEAKTTSEGIVKKAKVKVLDREGKDRKKLEEWRMSQPASAEKKLVETSIPMRDLNETQVKGKSTDKSPEKGKSGISKASKKVVSALSAWQLMKQNSSPAIQTTNPKVDEKSKSTRKAEAVKASKPSAQAEAVKATPAKKPKGGGIFDSLMPKSDWD
eukprot:760121-Hanusia_phi.AAC.3